MIFRRKPSCKINSIPGPNDNINVDINSIPDHE